MQCAISGEANFIILHVKLFLGLPIRALFGFSSKPLKFSLSEILEVKR